MPNRAERCEKMDTTLEPREWKLEELSWQNVNEVRTDDIIRISNLKTARIAGWLGDLKGAVSGQWYGRKFLLDFGRGNMETLYLVEGHESAYVREE